MPWTVEFYAEFCAEFGAFDADVRKAIAAYAMALASEGRQLGRPMADTLKGSKHANMKELRPTVNRVEWRVAYAFDMARKAIVLAAAAKGGKSSTLVYRQMIAKADTRFTAHQAARPPCEALRHEEEARTMTDGPKPGATVPLADVLAEFSAEDQAEIGRHADRLIQESRTLAEFRRETGMTQAELADALATSQAYIAKLEQRPSTDMHLSTIARIAAALGAQVKVVVSLPGKPDATLALPNLVKRKRAARAKAGSDQKPRLASA